MRIGRQRAAIERLGVGLPALHLGDLTKTVIGILALRTAGGNHRQIILAGFRQPAEPAIDAGAIVERGRKIR